jgi:glycosyltransferase involved in cell wall biosynthesis
LRVVYLLDWFLFYVTELSNAMAEQHDVLVIPRDHAFEVSSPDEPMSLDEYLRSTLRSNVRTDRMKYRRSDPRSVLEIARIQRVVCRWNADVVHFQDTVDWRVAALALLNRKRRTVLTIHDVESHIGESRGLQGCVFKILVRSVKAIVVHGDALREQFLRAYPQLRTKVEVASIPHGTFSLYKAWDDPGVSEEPNTILFFGRISPYKGLEDLIAAQPLVSAAVPDARFVIAGRGQDFGAYRSRIRDPRCFEIHNRFIPNREVPRLFRRAAVVVLPYREASQSGVIPIAYAFGKPVVATRVGSLPEVVEDGSSGIVVDPGRPDDLARALITILKDVNLRRRLGEGARRIGETRLSWRNIAKTTSELYAGNRT